MSSSSPNGKSSKKKNKGATAAAKSSTVASDSSEAKSGADVPASSPATTTTTTTTATSSDAPLNRHKDLTSADYYFNSYAHFGIHEEMLKDTVRTTSYRKACARNPNLRNKVVLDVGCGTGILCMFAAQSGAKHVYGVDCSDIIDQARVIIKDNGFEDVITLIQGKIEEVELPVEHVDVIISEWMGYFLLYESMLDSVLFARDKWLVPGGLMLPDRARLVIGGIEDAAYRAQKIDWWYDVYGFDMSVIREVAIQEPLVDIVEPHMVCTQFETVFEIDVTSVTVPDLAFDVPFSLTATRDDTIHALTAHFDVDFNHTPKPFGFSTSPECEYTHWKHTVFYLQDPVHLREGQTLSGRIRVRPNEKNRRDLNVTIDFVSPEREWTQDYMLR